MSQPEIVQADLADEDVVARVDLGGEDELFVTPTRTLLYRAEGLLSDESVEEYSHDAERITVSEGRRKAKVTLDYGLDGQRTLSMPSKRLERALEPILEAVLRTNGVLADEESIERLFRFSELTIVVASERVVRHIGGNLWDEDFEAYHYDDVTDLVFEDGSVATSVVLTVDGRQERFKAPNDDARAVRAVLETTLLSHWNVDSVEELRAATAPDEDDGDAEKQAEEEEVSFGDGPDPLIADPAEPEDFPENATRSPDDREGQSEPSPDALAQQVERPPASEMATDAERTADNGTASETPATSGAEAASDTGTAGGDDPSRADAAGETDRAQASESGASSSDGSTRDAPSNGASTPGERDEIVRGRTGSADATTGAEGSDAAPTDTRADAAESFRPDPGFEGSGFESAAENADEELRAELAELREVVEQQNEELRAQRELVEQLIEELRRGR